MEFLPTEPRPLGSEFLSGRSRNSAGRVGQGRIGEERIGEESRKIAQFMVWTGEESRNAQKEAGLAACLVF